MNKEEVKNALEYCINGDGCVECPFFRSETCEFQLIKIATQCINEQEKEIEQHKNDYDKAFERLKAQQREINRLQQKLADVLVCIKDTNGEIDVEKLQKQAVKEFAEKLKEKSWANNPFDNWAGPSAYVVFVKDIDKLLEEYN